MDRRNSSLMWMYPVLLVFALGVLGWGIFLMATERPDREIFAAGCLSVVAVLLAWFLNLNLKASREETLARLADMMAPVNERMQHLSMLLHQVSEQQLISERSKAIAFRDKEREALRRAIREEMSRKDWEAAITLANDIETAFGYKQEADRLRGEIQTQWDSEMRKAVNEGLAVIDRACMAEQWTQAMHEAERLAKLFPDDPQAQHLPQDVDLRRQKLKQQLLDNWNGAVARHDVDESIDILKRLDMYLTPQEAESMQEAARQVFKDKLQLMGQQFANAMRDHHWAEAIRLGEAIANEFPNSRMAQEVREKMDLLKQRASEPVSVKA